jgi:hypothetical protein
LIVGGPAAATVLEQALLTRGFLCPAVAPPAVAADKCRIRLTVTAMHTAADIDGLLNAIEELWPEAACTPTHRDQTPARPPCIPGGAPRPWHTDVDTLSPTRTDSPDLEAANDRA